MRMTALGLVWLLLGGCATMKTVGCTAADVLTALVVSGIPLPRYDWRAGGDCAPSPTVFHDYNEMESYGER